MSGIRKQSSWALKLQLVRINNVQSRTAPRQPLQARTVYTGGTALKQKAIYLLNTPSGLFIAVVHGTHPLESQCPPGCLLRSGKSKWLFHWMRHVKPLGQIAGTNRACCFPTFCWEALGILYHRRHISFQKEVHTVEVACHIGGFIFKWEFSGEVWLMALYRCTSTCLVSLRPFPVLMLYAMAAGASCILNCGYLRSGMDGASVGGFERNVHHYRWLKLYLTRCLLALQFIFVLKSSIFNSPFRQRCKSNPCQQSVAQQPSSDSTSQASSRPTWVGPCPVLVNWCYLANFLHKTGGREK